ncbi:heterokaryon incompatibility protein-domain-containing protein [Xylaria sp. FL0064]|nr:heterokaryon incompatibility protein-domain-containing protein [Xylaria sp. FL0064]
MDQISNSITTDSFLELDIPFRDWHVPKKRLCSRHEDPCKHGLWTKYQFLNKGVFPLIELIGSINSGCQTCGLILRAVEEFMLPHRIKKESTDVSIRAYCPAYLHIITFQVLQKGQHAGAFQLLRKPREEPLYPRIGFRARVNRRKPTLKYSMDIISDTRTSEAFDRAMRWLSHCRANCTGCNRGRDSSFMPKRLINVGCNRTRDTPDRVFLFDVVSPAPYVCLSYCWGVETSTVIRTLTSNREAHGSGILISVLPQTIQDAITVCRGINIQNLWVDSLCIVQDDKVDWSQEAGRMFDIYLNSELTIYARQSPNCKIGFLGPQKYGSPGWQRSLGTIVAPKLIDSTDEFLLRTGELDSEAKRCPLDTRGWSLQELIAPNRRLIRG